MYDDQILPVLPRQSKTIRPHPRELFKIDLKIKVLEGFYGRRAPCSAISVKHLIDVGGGVIDSDFRRVIHVILLNHSFCPCLVNLREKVAQLIFELIEVPIFTECDDFCATGRDFKDFGSSGV